MTKNRSDSVCLIILSAIFVYVVLRAVAIPITHDEAYSFHNMKSFWLVEALCTGNTHWLNSAAIKLTILLNHESVFAIRWLSLLSSLVFFSIIYMWIRSSNGFFLKFFILCLSVLNPYVLDYFSVARGYASGILFEGLALALFFSYLSNRNKNLSALSLFCAGLAAITNYSFVYFFMAFSLLYFSRLYLSAGKSFLKEKQFYRDSLFVLIILMFVLRAFVFISRCSNDVIGAGTNNISEFVRVFADGLLYSSFNLQPMALSFFGAILFSLLLLSAAYGVFSNAKTKMPMYYYASLMLLLQMILIFAGHFFFQFVLPSYRSAIFLFPLSVFCFVCFAEFLITNSILKKGILSLLSGALILNFFFSMNFNSVFDYSPQADIQRAFDHLERKQAKRVGIDPELYGGFRNYFQMTGKYTYSFEGEEINTRTELGKSPNKTDLSRLDYLIVLPPYHVNAYKSKTMDLKVEKYFPGTGTLILKLN